MLRSLRIWSTTRSPVHRGAVRFLHQLHQRPRLRSRTGFVRRPLDNVGVQYGLVAFNAGKISAAQFIELNERIGGFDEQGRIVPARMEATTDAVRAAYVGGVLLDASKLAETPIIDWRDYVDELADGHEMFRSFATRARLVAANGHADNQVILVDSRRNLRDFSRSAFGD